MFTYDNLGINALYPAGSLIFSLSNQFLLHVATLWYFNIDSIIIDFDLS